MPIFSGKVIVGAKVLKRIIEDLRLLLPKEILQAKTIVADRTKILEDAKIEAKSIIEVAQERVKYLTGKEEISKLAKETADDTIRNARIKAKEMKDSANKYVFKLMKETDKFLSAHLSEIRRIKQGIRSAEVDDEKQ